jgi:hypothetical protein
MKPNPILDSLDESLRLCRFCRREHAWNRPVGEFIDVVDLQVSKSRTDFTINAGVLHKGIYEKCWGKSTPDSVQEPYCTVRIRIGELTDRKELWFGFADFTSIAPVWDRLWRGSAVSRRDAFAAANGDFLREKTCAASAYPLSAINLALVKAELADVAGACAVLRSTGERASGEWRKRIAEIGSRIGCAPLGPCAPCG